MTSQINISNIPIKNIFYMLVYSWGYPQEQNLISITQKDHKDLTNMFADVLIKKLKILIKKGIYKEYKDTQEHTSIIKGKINFKDSLKKFSFKRGKLDVEYEELTIDTVHNQIIKKIITSLLQYEGLETQFKLELSRILKYFVAVSDINIQNKDFENLLYHKNNYHYKFIIILCRFIWEKLLLHESTASEQTFNDFSRDHKELATLFEKFVRSFYATELKGAKVKSQQFNWASSGSIAAFLPVMRTDISIELAEEKIILDTKFYHNALNESYGKQSIRSAHVYQVFSYLKNDITANNKKQTGILLYPQVEKAITLNGKIHDYEFKVCTVNLYAEWRKIHDRLLEVINL
jgi:5-methylcytosine-specific restriction enzyme subunit McrC